MTESTSLPAAGISRRRLLVLGGSMAGGALILAACGDDDDTASTAATTPPSDVDGPVPTAKSGSTAATNATAATATTTDVTDVSTSGTVSSTGTPATTVFTAADFAGLGVCAVLPDLTQGPFPTIDPIERRDITEGKAGLPLRVGIQVVDESCAAIPDAVVEIWHCDIDGDYSAYADGYTDDDAGEGTTYFRGAQVADGDGIVEFLTVYPGWYSGRAVHIHAKVHIGDSTVLTTQFLFADDLNDEVMATEPYAPFGEPDTTNETDGVTGGSGVDDGLVMTVSDDAAIAGRRALIVVGLDPGATSQGAGGGMGGSGQGGGPGGPPPGGSRPPQP